MKYDNFAKVPSLMLGIDELNKQLLLAEDGGPALRISVDGEYQDIEIINAARPAVLGVLTVRKIEKLQALKKLGVDVSEVPAEPMTDWLRLDMLDSYAHEADIDINLDTDSGDIEIVLNRVGMSTIRSDTHSNIRDAIDALVAKP
mgnify:FL=1